MIRFPELVDEFKDSLEDLVELSLPSENLLISPLDKIMPPLFETHQEINVLFGNLSEETTYSIPEIKHFADVVGTAEKAAATIIECSFSSHSYRLAAAKAVALGDRIDKIIYRHIKSIESHFKQSFKDLNESTPLSLMSDKRSELRDCMNGFFNLSSIYQSRGLSIKNISSAVALFNSYSDRIKDFHLIDEEIQELKEKYAKTPLQDMNTFASFAAPLLKTGLFSSGSVAKKCKKSEYYEGLAELMEIKAQLDYFSNNTRLLSSINSRFTGLQKKLAKLEDVLSHDLFDEQLNVQIKQDYASLEIALEKIKNDNVRGRYLAEARQIGQRVSSMSEKSEILHSNEILKAKKLRQDKIDSKRLHSEYFARISLFYQNLDELDSSINQDAEKQGLVLKQSLSELSSAEAILHSIELLNEANEAAKKHKAKNFAEYLSSLSQDTLNLKEKSLHLRRCIDEFTADYNSKLSLLRRSIAKTEKEIDSSYSQGVLLDFQNDYNSALDCYGVEIEDLAKKDEFLKYSNDIYCLLKFSKNVRRALEEFKKKAGNDSYLSSSKNFKDSQPCLKAKSQSAISGRPFSISFYMHEIGHPSNADYYKMWNILSGKIGKKDLNARLALLSQEATNSIRIDSVDDKRYLVLIAEGVQSLMQYPPGNLDLEVAKKAYNSLSQIIDSALVA